MRTGCTVGTAGADATGDRLRDGPGRTGCTVCGAGAADDAAPPLPIHTRGAFQALDARGERARDGIELGLGGLHERELELGARVGAGPHGLQRRAEQLEQPHRGAGPDALRPARQARVELGCQRELGGDLAEGRTTSSSRARTSRSRGERTGVAAALRAARDRAAAPRGRRRHARASIASSRSCASATPSTASTSASAISLPL